MRYLQLIVCTWALLACGDPSSVGDKEGDGGQTTRSSGMAGDLAGDAAPGLDDEAERSSGVGGRDDGASTATEVTDAADAPDSGMNADSAPENPSDDSSEMAAPESDAPESDAEMEATLPSTPTDDSDQQAPPADTDAETEPPNPVPTDNATTELATAPVPEDTTEIPSAMPVPGVPGEPSPESDPMPTATAPDIPAPVATPVDAADPTEAGPTIRASTAVDAFAQAGLDPNNLPGTLTEADSVAHFTLMQSFTGSLGVTCGACHTSNYAESTPEKAIARHMWNDILAKLEFKDGSPLYCDSCHQGRMQFLDRSNPAAVAAWMNENMVKPLQRRDGGEHDCSTCHGNPPTYELLETWAQ